MKDSTILTGRDFDRSRNEEWFAVRISQGRGVTEDLAIEDLLRQERVAAMKAEREQKHG